MPTYDKAAYLELTLASYLGQTSRDFELIIVNDGCRDDTDAVVEKYRRRLDIKYIQQANAGRSRARNAALEVAEGDVVVFSDDDRIVPPGFVAAHAEQLRDGADDKYVLGWQMGILTRWRKEVQRDPRVASFLLRNPEVQELTKTCDQVPLTSAAEVERDTTAVVKRLCTMEPWWNSRGARVVEAFSTDLSGFRLAWVVGTTGNMSVRRAALREVGWFDESFTGWGVEDNELCFRLSQKGARAVISREAINYHQVHPQAPTVLDEWERNLERFANKYQSVDVALFRLWAQGRDPVVLDAISKECATLQQSGQTHVVDELRRLYAALAAVEKAQQWW